MVQGVLPFVQGCAPLDVAPVLQAMARLRTAAGANRGAMPLRGGYGNTGFGTAPQMPAYK